MDCTQSYDTSKKTQIPLLFNPLVKQKQIRKKRQVKRLHIVTRPLFKYNFPSFQLGSSGPYGGQPESNSTQCFVIYIYIFQSSLLCVLFSSLFCSDSHASSYSLKYLHTNIVDNCALCIVHCALCVVHCAKCSHFRMSIACNPCSHNN